MYDTYITQLYSLCGLGLVFSYLPQIRTVWKDKGGAQAVSLATWGFWIVTGMVSVAYAVVVTKAPAFIFVSSGNLAGSITIFTLAAWRRKLYLRTQK